MVSDKEKELWKKYAKMTGIDPVGYSDILHVLLSDDLFPLLEEIIKEKQSSTERR